MATTLQAYAIPSHGQDGPKVSHFCLLWDIPNCEAGTDKAQYLQMRFGEGISKNLILLGTVDDFGTFIATRAQL